MKLTKVLCGRSRNHLTDSAPEVNELIRKHEKEGWKIMGPAQSEKWAFFVTVQKTFPVGTKYSEELYKLKEDE